MLSFLEVAMPSLKYYYVSIDLIIIYLAYNIAHIYVSYKTKDVLILFQQIKKIWDINKKNK